MRVSLYISLRDVPEDEVAAFIKDLKDFLASKYAGKDITIIFNHY